jgi:hypothetical protein
VKKAGFVFQSCKISPGTRNRIKKNIWRCLVTDDELEEFIGRLKPSSWGIVEKKTLNGRTARWISPAKRPNVENSLIKMIDATRAGERGWDMKNKR